MITQIKFAFEQYTCLINVEKYLKCHNNVIAVINNESLYDTFLPIKYSQVGSFEKSCR